MIGAATPHGAMAQWRGRIIRKGVGKLPKKEQVEIEEGLEKLLSIRPTTREDVKEPVHDMALRYWFEAMTGNSGRDESTSAKRTNAYEDHDEIARELAADVADGAAKRYACNIGLRIGIKDPYGIITQKEPDATRLFVALALRLIDAEALDIKRLDEIKRLNNELQGVARATGQALGEQKTITLSECFDHFKKTFKSGSEKSYDDAVKRVGYVIEALGSKTLHCTVTKGAIPGRRVARADI